MKIRDDDTTPAAATGSGPTHVSAPMVDAPSRLDALRRSWARSQSQFHDFVGHEVTEVGRQIGFAAYNLVPEVTCIHQ